MKFKIFNTNLLFFISGPLIGLIIFASYIINDSVKIVKNISNINTLIQLSIVNSALVHELQIERGMSNVVIKSEGDKFSRKLAIQRQATDLAVKQHHLFLQQTILTIKNILPIDSALLAGNTGTLSSPEVNLEYLISLARIRSQVDSFTITSDNLIAFYSNLNNELMSVIIPTIKLANKEGASNLLQAHYNLIQAKEYAGLERAFLSNVLNINNLTRSDIQNYSRMQTAQSLNLNAFLMLSDLSIKQFYQKIMSEKSVDKVKELRNLVLNNDNFEFDGISWFKYATERINLLKKVENFSVEKIKELTLTSTEKAKNTLFFSFIYSLLAISLTIVLYYQLSKSLKKQKQSQQLLKKFKLIVDNSPHFVIITTPEGYIEYSNKRCLSMTGYTSDEIIGLKPSQWRSEQTLGTTYKDIKLTTNNGQTWSGELLNKHKSGTFYWAKTSIFPVQSQQGEILHLIGIQEDVTQKKQDQEKIKHLANHDSLTGLPSLRLGKDRLEQGILSAKRHKLTMALMFIDLDGFKTINDEYGHVAGDTVLKEIGTRMVAELRLTDTIARIGGDEFMAILTNVKDPLAIDRVATKILAAVQAPVYYQKASLTVGASIGIALCPADGVTSEELLEKADHAMYSVKKSGKNNYAYYNPKFSS